MQILSIKAPSNKINKSTINKDTNSQTYCPFLKRVTDRNRAAYQGHLQYQNGYYQLVQVLAAFFVEKFFPVFRTI
jgi:hypothetical protein